MRIYLWDMRMLLVGSFLIANLIQLHGHPQDTSDLYEREVRLVVDNDVFTSLWRDQYYTSGLFGMYRKLGRHDDQFKRIFTVTLSQRIFTPQYLSWRLLTSLDRPYAGTLSFEAGWENYHSRGFYSKINSEIGILGPGSGVSTLHPQWHRILGLVPPEGWEYEIGNMPILNLFGTISKSLVDDPNLDVITETNLAAGTLYTFARQELLLRVGKLRKLFHSVHYNAILGTPKNQSQPGLREVYGFISPGIEYNFYNSTIEGRLIGAEDVHTEVAERWILQSKVGLMFSWEEFDWQIFHYVRSRETTEAAYHIYMGMHINYRF